jgi:SAM-dependent methyltransferase
MSSKYKYFHDKSSYLIPKETKGRSFQIKVETSQKPIINSTIKENTYEVTDNHLFYTDITGEYVVIVYEIDNLQIVKYKLQYSIIYNVCVKSTSKELKYKIDKEYEIVGYDKFASNVKLMEFDPQSFFDYDFRFFDLRGELVCYYLNDTKLYIKIQNMILFTEIPSTNTVEYYTGELYNGKLYVYDCEESLPFEKAESRTHIISKSSSKVVCYEVIKTVTYIMVWYAAEQLYFNAYFDGRELKIIDDNNLKPNKFTPRGNYNKYEIYKVYRNRTEINQNALHPSSINDIKMQKFTTSNFAEINNFDGTFEFMVKLHRNIIRGLYDKYVYVDVLDIGIGKCRDVQYYQKYVDIDNIYGVEPNKEFSKFCNIAHVYDKTADDIFTHLKSTGFKKKFHTIIFCNSYNFVSDPLQTMKECVEFLAEGGRIIMVYMNNDKVVTEKNKYYEIRREDAEKKNFIQVFTDYTLVPPHFENQIGESDILKAVETINKSHKILEVIDKKSLVHPRSEWLLPETKLFNSMFYYVVVGLACKVNKIIIAIDPNTSSLLNYINSLRKKEIFCNGIDILHDELIIPSENKAICICVDTVDKYKKIRDKIKSEYSVDVIINSNKKDILEYSSYYKTDIDAFDRVREEIKKIVDKYSEFT